MTTTVLDILTDARAIIADPSHWIRAALARDELEDECEISDPNATAFCAVGAVLRAMGNHAVYGNATIEYGAIHALSKFIDLPMCTVTPHSMVTYFNDSRSHADVLAMFDRAIASTVGTLP